MKAFADADRVSCVLCVYCTVVASGQAATSPDQARKLGYASLGVSVAGIIVIIIVSIMASKQNQ